MKKIFIIFILSLLCTPLNANELWVRWLQFNQHFLNDEIVFNCGVNHDYKIIKLLGLKMAYQLEAGDWKKMNEASFGGSYLKAKRDTLSPKSYNLHWLRDDDETISKLFVDFLPQEVKKNISSAESQNAALLNIFEEYFILQPLPTRYVRIDFKDGKRFENFDPFRFHIEFRFTDKAINNEGIEQYKSEKAYWMREIPDSGAECKLTK